jgi:hypothetical protein
MRSAVASNVDHALLLYGLTDDAGNQLTSDGGEALTSDDYRGLSVGADAALARIVAGSHQMAARADVLFDRQVIAEGLNLVGGLVSYDRTAATLASCAVEIADPTRIPVSSTDVLTPYGYEIQLWRGVTTGGGTIMCPLGVFPIQKSSVDGVTLISSIVGQDRSRLVSDAIFEETYRVAAGTNYVTAIQELIEDGVSGLTFNFPSTSFTTPALTFGPDDDRWIAAQSMARAIGNEILFGGVGECAMRAEPSFNGVPVAAIAEGANMTGITLDLNRGPAFNKVIATSANGSLGAQYRGEASDDDASSPTYYLGPFGKKARRDSSPFLASDAQCNAAAAAKLASNLGVANSVSASLLTDPRLETSDVVRVTRSALGIDELHIIDQLTIGLGATAPMTAGVRAQQVAS